MIIPSIDLMGGQAVQLVGGEKLAVEAGDPRPLARAFGLTGEIAVVDLDAALGQGSNAALVEELLLLAPCRVGGGIRDVRTAERWLDAGATKVMLGTAARVEVLRDLPRERVVAALDARQGEVVVEGWRKPTGASVTDRMEELREHVGGFLVTSVEREGRLQGIDQDQVAQLIEAAKGRQLTVAGGITTPAEVASLDALGADAQVGMALYTGRFSVADTLVAMLRSDRADGLWPTVVTNELGEALGLTFSSAESLRQALNEQRGIYQSRTRGLWRKGETSGATQILLRVALDCDRDALRFTVRQAGAGFCHKKSASCWGPLSGLSALVARLEARTREAPKGSYTRRLLDEPELLAVKLSEEAAELAEAAGAAAVTHEAADVLYFTLVAMLRAGVSLDDVMNELDRRAYHVTRRGGDAKPTSGGRTS